MELVEQSTGELSFGAGYSTAEGVIGDCRITERNLIGNGQFLRLKFAGSFERLQVDLSFTEPRFLDRNLAAGFDLFHKEIDQTRQSGFEQPRTGGGVRLGFPLSENLWMQTSYSVVAQLRSSTSMHRCASRGHPGRDGHVLHVAGRHDADLR